MKKFFVGTFFGILFSGIFSVGFSQALMCPFSDFEYQSEEGKIRKLSEAKDCSEESKYETLLSGVFLEQRNIFLKNLNTLYKDNSNHPNTISKKRTQIIKESRQCFETICEKIVNLCQNKTSTFQSEIRRLNQCEEKMHIFFETHLFESSIALQKNAQRKQRSVFREKFRQIEGKMRNYFVRLSIFLYNRLTDFDAKFTNFTAEPS